MSHSILEESIASRPTPGSRHFTPFAITPDMEGGGSRTISHYPSSRRSAVLPLLHIVQRRFGYISAAAIEWVAATLELEPIKVLEVVTFYPGFRQSAPGRFHIRVCRTLSCAMGGSHELMERLCELTGIDRTQLDPHHHPIAVSPCGNFSVEFAECLAACGTAPVCMVNDDFHEGVCAGKAEELLAKYVSDQPPGPITPVAAGGTD